MTTATHSPKEQFLHQYDNEHAITRRVLKAFPPDKMDLRPHPRCPTARELAWIFVGERGLGARVFDDEFAKGVPSAKRPGPPDTWPAVLEALEKAHLEFRNRVVATPDEELFGKVKFFTGPKTLGDVGRLEFAWFLLHDQIHHRGQFSIYLRMAEGKVPSIYGPSGDEPWN
jgi:uncharacterized damage-inducible protein DinB